VKYHGSIVGAGEAFRTKTKIANGDIGNDDLKLKPRFPYPISNWDSGPQSS
jgi:hypothetical protein